MSSLDDYVLQLIAMHRDKLSTPIYIYSEQQLNESVSSYKSLFPENSKLFYSLKANPQPELVKHFLNLGLGAEISGEGEWQWCTIAGVQPSNILVGGVSKSKSFFSVLCNTIPIAIVIESEKEWQRLKEIISLSHQIPVLLRVNPGVSFGGLNMAGGSQFGLSLEQSLVIARECRTINQVDFWGLHFYFGSQRLDIQPILKMLLAIEQVVETFREAKIKLKVIDLGLGLGVPYLVKDKALDISTLREQLQLKWQSETWLPIEIWSEAGRAFVANAGYFIARVTEKKYLHGKTFVFLDGGINVHNPGVGLGRFFRSNPVFLFITNALQEKVETIDIVGNLCTSADCLGQNIEAPRLEEGDLIVIPNSGAYCQTTAFWGFNSQPLFNEAMLMENGTLKILQAQHHL